MLGTGTLGSDFGGVSQGSQAGLGPLRGVRNLDSPQGSNFLAGQHGDF